MRVAGLVTISALAAAFTIGAMERDANALTQPSGVTIPTDPGCNSGMPTGLLAAFACVCTTPGICNIGAPCPSETSCDDGKKGTCESTMWHVFNDNTCIPSMSSGLDPKAEAATTPETFRPTCALTFTVVTRGTAQFHDLFGWYNVTDKKPEASDLHPMLGCSDAAGKSVVLDLSKETAYRGGEIGFFLLTPESHAGDKKCAGGDCCGSLARLAAGEGYVYYSERKYNPDLAGSTATSYIHLLTYNSHLSKTKFYFAWEDIFGGSNNDFTDLVASVDGVQCAGGGVSCDTTKKGRCAYGVTQCAAGAVSCTPLFAPQAEKCDGVDDDCNGTIDDGATCPTAGDLCRDGRCVPPCGKGEFKCGSGTACDPATSLCVDPKCVGMTCEAGKICRGGACGTPCGDVVCPHGQACVDDACVDLCASTKCPAGQVCREGVCFDGCASCSGISCGPGTKCDGTSNECLDPSCTTPCAAGTFCKAGACVDACDGAKCPSGQTCEKGRCVGPGAVDPGGPDGGIGPGTFDAGADAAAGPSATPGELPAAGACQCDVVGGASSAPSPLLGVAIALLAAYRRRRSISPS